MFQEKLFRQAIEFPTWSISISDVAYYFNCFLSAEKNFFSKISNCSDHEAIYLFMECTENQAKVTMQNFRSFCSANYEAINHEKP